MRLLNFLFKSKRKPILTDEIQNALNKNFCRKPSKFEEMEKKPLVLKEQSKEVRQYLESLPLYKTEDLYDDEFEFTYNPFNYFRQDITIPQYFILSYCGKRYLIDTQGYAYVRYGVQLK